jgi:hypothetical protein
MTTCREVITFGLKLARVLSPGDEMEADEATDGLFTLQGMFDAWATGGMFGRLTDVYKEEAYEAAEQERVTSTSTVTRPTTITNDGDERTPYDLSLIEQIESGTRKVYLYDRTAWVRIDALTLDDDCPLAMRGKDGLAAAFAIRFVEMFGGDTITPSVAGMARHFIGQISHKHASTSPVQQGSYF